MTSRSYSTSDNVVETKIKRTKHHVSDCVICMEPIYNPIKVCSDGYHKCASLMELHKKNDSMLTSVLPIDVNGEAFRDVQLLNLCLKLFRNRVAAGRSYSGPSISSLFDDNIPAADPLSPCMQGPERHASFRDGNLMSQRSNVFIMDLEDIDVPDTQPQSPDYRPQSHISLSYSPMSATIPSYSPMAAPVDGIEPMVDLIL